MIIVLEGLDGVGKTTLLKNLSDELYEFYLLSSYIVSPTRINKELLQVINKEYNSPLDKFQDTIKEHIKILDKLKEYNNKFNFIFLDRSIYSAFAYTMYLEQDTTIKEEALHTIKQLEKEYHLYSLFLNIPEETRLERLKNRNLDILFDSCNSKTNSAIYNEFIYLVLHSGLINFINPEYIKLHLINKFEEENKLNNFC